jgi:hypothetical protein
MQPLFRALAFGAALTLGVPVMSLSAQAAADPAAGTWELNLAKSKFSPGPAPKSLTRTFEVSGTDVKYTAKGISAEGKPTLLEYTAKYDGKDYPVTGSQDFDAISLKQVDAATSVATLKKGGKVVQTTTRVVSKDGKTLTLTVKGKNAKGQAVDNVMVFDKQ